MKLFAKTSFLSPAAAVGSEPRVCGAFRLFGVRIHNSRMADALAYIMERTCGGWPPCNLAFVNADCLNKAWGDAVYSDVLNGFERVYADGSGIRLACRWSGIQLLDNVNGTDLFPLLCAELAAKGRSLFLLGGFPGIGESCAAAMQQRFPGLRVAGVQHGYFAPEALPEVTRRINASGADVLLVGFGAPAQELWIYRHSHELAPRVRIGVGGLFDFYSGRIPRAPLWLRKLGLEWTWRLAQEPARMWRRYLLGNPLFLWRAWRRPARWCSLVPSPSGSCSSTESATNDRRNRRLPAPSPPGRGSG